MKLRIVPGSIFGELTVVKETPKRDRGCKVWECQCTCGELTDVRTDYLQQGWKKSCGCLRIRRAYERIDLVRSKRHTLDPVIYKLNTLIRNTKSGAKKRGLTFELTDEQIVELARSNCHYCGSNNWNENCLNSGSTVYSDFYMGVDRKDNEIGYTAPNCVPCCKICNRGKRDMPYKDFVAYISRIKTGSMW